MDCGFCVGSLANRKIINGYVNGHFGPADHILASQFVKMLVLTFGLPVDTRSAQSPEWFRPYYDILKEYEYDLDLLKYDPHKKLSRPR